MLVSARKAPRVEYLRLSQAVFGNGLLTRSGGPRPGSMRPLTYCGRLRCSTLTLEVPAALIFFTLAYKVSLGRHSPNSE